MVSVHAAISHQFTSVCGKQHDDTGTYSSSFIIHLILIGKWQRISLIFHRAHHQSIAKTLIWWYINFSAYLRCVKGLNKLLVFPYKLGFTLSYLHMNRALFLYQVADRK